MSQVSGQISPDCASAIRICDNTPRNGGTFDYGVDDFNGVSESGCLEPTSTGYIESNSAWYWFRTGASGQLGFNISFDSSEDWDFALYRASDCSDLGEPVRCNFFDNRDEEVYMGVGEDPTGDTDTFLYEPWLDVSPGENYILVINNFSNTNSGFSIQFSGEIFVTNPFDALDCNIIENLIGPPVAACEGETITLNGSQDMATSYQWFADTGSGYNPIPGETSATYQATTSALYLVEVSLSDGTLIRSEAQVGFSPVAQTEPVSDESLCMDQLPFNLSTKDGEALGSQDPSMFRVSYHPSLADANAGQNALPLSYSPGAGDHTIYIRTTPLENPDCYDASESFILEAVTSPVLDFPQQVFICSDGGSALIGPELPENGVDYQWNTGETSAQITVNQPGIYTLDASAAGSGSSCQASRTVEVLVSTPPSISGILIEGMQASNRVEVMTEAQGEFEYALNSEPFQTSPVFENVPAGNHVLRMRDIYGCGEISETITVIGFPAFFTPNGDGLNDLWQVVGLDMLTEPTIHIFDRYGKLLKELDQSSAGWDGTYLGRPMPGSDYWFRLFYINSNGEREEAQYIRTHFALKR